ncbi:ParB/RepB/Spo0J family partition protein [Acaryochloris marina NIES-2412]|uniref:ParB/RepB/Spo0J family partition protein n=1 Tax=Acaryochloris marina TaxID=155978 RepID=UPI004059FDF5
MSFLKVDNSFTMLKLSDITVDNEIQPRQQLNQEVVAEYTEAMRQGGKFPPVIVFYDGTKYWLADGFHRVQAKLSTGDCDILVELIPGTWRDALLYAVGANATHGLRRTNADKRRAVTKLLLDKKWREWSSREIARRCGVNHKTVDKLRAELDVNLYSEKLSSLSGESRQKQKRMVRRNGKVQSMNISNIGTKSAGNKHTLKHSKAIQEIDGNYLLHQKSKQQLVVKAESPDQLVPYYKPFRIIDAESVPSDASDPHLEIYSRILVEGPIKAWSIILTQMQTHPDFAEMIWREAQDLWANSN